MTTPLWQQHHVDGVRFRVVDEMHSRVFLCVKDRSERCIDLSCFCHFKERRSDREKMYYEFVGR